MVDSPELRKQLVSDLMHGSVSKIFSMAAMFFVLAFFSMIFNGKTLQESALAGVIFTLPILLAVLVVRVAGGFGDLFFASLSKTELDSEKNSIPAARFSKTLLRILAMGGAPALFSSFAGNNYQIAADAALVFNTAAYCGILIALIYALYAAWKPRQTTASFYDFLTAASFVGTKAWLFGFPSIIATFQLGVWTYDFLLQIALPKEPLAQAFALFFITAIAAALLIVSKTIAERTEFIIASASSLTFGGTEENYRLLNGKTQWAIAAILFAITIYSAAMTHLASLK